MQPLSGLMVIDLTENVAGPYCTMILGDLGADVIKIERPDGGDPMRAWGPPFTGPDSSMFVALNRNKRSVTLDLKSAGDRQTLERLLERAHVVVQSFAPATARRWGVQSEQLRARYPHLIACDVSAFNPQDCRAEDRGYDPLIQALSGLMSVTGEPDGEPVRVGTSIIDMGTGLWAALAILAQLVGQEGGQGGTVSACLFDTGLSWMTYHITGYLSSGLLPRPMGTHLDRLAPYGAFSACDGSVVVAVGNDAIWHRFCIAIGRSDLAHDKRFESNHGRVVHRRELHTEILSTIGRESVDYWLATFSDHAVPASSIRTIRQLLEDPATSTSNMLESWGRSETEHTALVRFPALLNGERPAVMRGPPRHGEHSLEVLDEFGV